MSVQALSCAFIIKGFSPSEKLVLLALANYADPQMRCFPSHSTLADDTGLSERTILTVLKALAERGMLTRQERRRPDGSRSTDVITLHFAGEMVSPRGEIDGQTNPQLTVVGGEMVSPPTTFEPRTNRQIEEPILVARAPTNGRASKRCPETFTPSQADVAVGEGLGFKPGEIERQLSKFRDHTFAAARSDWSATFRNWLRTAAERNPPNGRPDPKFVARHENFDASFAGAQSAARNRGR